MQKYTVDDEHLKSIFKHNEESEVKLKLTIEEIVKELEQLEELNKMQEMKKTKMIEEIEKAVLIMHPKQMEIAKLIGAKYVIFSKYCEEDKIYLVTDKALAQTVRKNIDSQK